MKPAHTPRDAWTLYRVFRWLPRVEGDAPGGPLYVPREKQGIGRHDIPDLDGVLYCSVDSVGAITESLQQFRGSREPITNRDLSFPDGRVLALATFRIESDMDLVDLDDPKELLRLRLRPSNVATRVRKRTQLIARNIHSENVDGFRWWSSIEASWINVTLFESRFRKRQRRPDVSILYTSRNEMIEAARILGLEIG